MSVNKERLTRVIEAIRAENLMKFDMRVWFDEESDCGTAGCIAGWCRVLEMVDKKEAVNDHNFHHVDDRYDHMYLNTWNWKLAAAWLGLDLEIARNLFHPTRRVDLGGGESEIMECSDDVSKYHAIRAMEYVRDGEDFTWDEILAGTDRRSLVAINPRPITVDTPLTPSDFNVIDLAQLYADLGMRVLVVDEFGIHEIGSRAQTAEPTEKVN